jgi:hypothetical protein
MILPTKLTKPFKYTEKGSLMRAAVLSDYAEEINDLYNAMESRLLSNVDIPSDWSPSSTLQFVQDVLGREGFRIGGQDNIFFNGCDSLLATRIEIIIRNVLKRVVKDSAAVNNLRNFIYDHPTPEQLALYVSDQVHSTSLQSGTQSSVDAMKKMIRDYGCGFPGRTSPISSKENLRQGVVALITGTTGGLGADLLAVLAGDPSVSKIYAINRSQGSAEILDRQKKVLAARGLDPDIACSPKVALVGNLAATDLGLGPEIRTEVRTSGYLLTLYSPTYRCKTQSPIFSTLVRLSCRSR